jgi:hypothetical protein
LRPVPAPADQAGGHDAGGEMFATQVLDADPWATDRACRLVEAGTGPAAERRLGTAIGSGLLPEVYVTDGALTAIRRVSGPRDSPRAGDRDAPLPVRPDTLTPALLAHLLARHATITRTEVRRDGTSGQVEVMPTPAVLAALLAESHWPGLPVLRDIVGAPVLRPDGTLLQTPGYDEATGYYYAPTVDLPAIPDQPAPAQVGAAREWLLGTLLGDFPWKTTADKANYVGLLATQILRHYTGALTPWVMVDATMPSSGKTILTSCLGMLYGQRVLTWTDSEEELRKAITSVFAEAAGCVVFDNIEEGHVVNSAVLARLVTERVWTDRKLGSSSTLSFENTRMWLATGNNLRTGADMATRTVWVRLDPDCPAPEARSGFTIPNLDTWILDKTNQATVLRAVLIMVLDWTAHGAPRDHTVPAMRQFTTWAQTVGGFLAHHNIPAFLGNGAESTALDEDAAEWAAFLHSWHNQFATTRMTAAQVRATAEPDPGFPDPWDGVFVTDKNGRVPNVKSLGRLLTGQIGRWRGSVVLRSVTDRQGHPRLYWVERSPDFPQTPKQTAQTA